MDNIDFKKEYIYDAFISYRHEKLDRKIAKKLHTLIETYKIPKSLDDKKKKKRIIRVFRDKEELPMAVVLSNAIENALQNSRCLIVICTPDTPSSLWVDKEIKTFIDLGKEDKIIPVVVKGTIESSFPKSLRNVVNIENKIIDIRSKFESRVFKNLKKSLNYIMSNVMYMSYEEVKKEHDKMAHRRFFITSLATILFFLFAVVFCYVQWQDALLAKNKANTEKQVMMQVIKNLTYKLPNQLNSIPNTYPIISDILDSNIYNLDQIAELNGNYYDVLYDKGVNYAYLGEVWMFLGDMTKATELEEKGIEAFRELINQDSENVDLQIDLASQYLTLGNILNYKGDYLNAEKYYNEAISILDDYNGSDSAKELLAKVYLNLGTIYSAKEDYIKEKEYYLKCTRILQDLDEYKYYDIKQTDLAKCYGVLGKIFLREGDIDQGSQYISHSIYILEEAKKKGAISKEATGDLGSFYLKKGTILLNEGDRERAYAFYEESIKIYMELAKDKSNHRAQQDLAECYVDIGNDYNFIGDYNQGGIYYEKGLEIYKRLTSDTSNIVLGKALGFCYGNIGKNLINKGEYIRSKEYFINAIDILQKYSDDKINNTVISNLADYYKYIGDILSFERDNEQARDYYLKSINIGEMLIREEKDISVQIALIETYTKVGNSFLYEKRYEQAEKYYEKSIIICSGIIQLPENHNSYVRRIMAEDYIRLGHCISERGDYDSATKYIEKSLMICEELLESINTKEMKQFTAQAYGVLPFYKILRGDTDYDNMKNLSLKAMELVPNQQLFKVNLAHVLLIQGDYDEAKIHYLAIKDIAIDNDRTLKDEMLKDLDLFKTVGINHPNIDKIEKILLNE